MLQQSQQLPAAPQDVDGQYVWATTINCDSETTPPTCHPRYRADVDTLCLYLVDCAQRLTKATLDRRIAAIGLRHKVAGHRNPNAEAKFRKVMAGVGAVEKESPSERNDRF
jgi:hypothetical protein